MNGPYKAVEAPKRKCTGWGGRCWRDATHYVAPCPPRYPGPWLCKTCAEAKADTFNAEYERGERGTP